MPIVDGLTSTKMIRSFEKSSSDEFLSRRAALNGRVPILAVSASLIEKNRQVYVDAGFDGWILKPIDFKRLTVIMSGIVEEEPRESCLYEPGEWERGGWFTKRQPDVFTSSTKPSFKALVSSSKRRDSYHAHPKEDSTDKERERLNQLPNDAVHADSVPGNPGRSGNIECAVESSSTRES